MRSGMLPVGSCYLHSFGEVEEGFGVGEFVEPLDFQASVFVFGSFHDEDRFPVHVHPDRALPHGGGL